MPNGSESHTLVTQVEIIDGNAIQASVEVDAIMPGEFVEISGYIAQNHGAFATFNEFQEIKRKLTQPAILTVSAKPTPTSPAFQQGHDVIVFVRVAKVWVTVLGEGPAQQPGTTPHYAGPGSVWGRLKGVAGSEDYSDTRGGNQSGSAKGDADQEGPDGPSNGQAD